MDRKDLVITSYYLGMGKGTMCKVTHTPTGLHAEEESQRYPDVPTLKRIEILTAELARMVEAHKAQ